MSLTHIHDATELACLSRCEQEHAYRHIAHWAAARDDDAAHFGQVVHAGRDAFFRTGDLDAALAALVPAWGDYVPAKDDKRTLALAVAIMRGYAEHVGTLEKRGLELLLAEEPLEDVDERYGGRVDAVVRIKGLSELCVNDLKTSKQSPSPRALQRYEKDMAISGYLDLAESKLGRPVGQAFIEHIFLSTRREGPKKEDFTLYGPIYYAPELRAELRQRRHEWIERAQALRNGAAPRMNDFACARYGGLCTYFDACKAPLDLREAVAESRVRAGEWVEREWDFRKRG